MLGDVTVVEVSDGLRGALAGRLFATLGAEVVLVEPPGGHPLREAVDDADRAAHYFDAVAAGKRSVVLRDTTAGPADALRDAADVVVTDRDAPPAWLQGTDAVTCTVTPFGRTGPLAGTPGDDAAVQAVTGITATSGFPDGAPAATAAPIAAAFAAVVAVGGVLAARRVDGADTIDVSQQDALLPLLTTLLPEYHATGESPTRSGNRHPIVAPWNTYRAADGWVYLIAFTDADWAAACEMIDRPDLADDERFERVADRRANAAALDDAIGEWIAARDADAVVAAAEARDLTAVTIADVAAGLDDANLRRRDAVVTVNGRPVAGSPFGLDAPSGGPEPAPTLDDWEGGS